jgi:peptidylprolyl isomerase
MEKPDVGPIAGPPPTDLVVEDLTTGEGPQAQPGQSATVHYVGVAHSTGQEFDSSWNRGQPFSFPLGGGRVIAGWDRGVVGMRVGGTGGLYKLEPTQVNASLAARGVSVANGQDYLVVAVVLAPEVGWEKVGELSAR